MATTDSRVLIVPCSGIGKVHGLLAREAVYSALDALGPAEAGTLCLSLVVAGDPDALQANQTRPLITVDGCQKMCAYKNAEMAGGRVHRNVRVIDVLKEYRGAKPGTATALTDEGWVIAEAMAEDLAAGAREILSGHKGAGDGR